MCELHSILGGTFYPGPIAKNICHNEENIYCGSRDLFLGFLGFEGFRLVKSTFEHVKNFTFEEAIEVSFINLLCSVCEIGVANDLLYVSCD